MIMLTKIFATIKKITFPEWSVPIALLVLCFVSYGFQIPGWGFYWDDWAKTLVDHIYGPSGYWEYYAYDRPLSAWTHILMLPFLGESPIAWQIFNFILRWLSTVVMWWSLGLLWFLHKRLLAFAAFLFAVYPIFTQQPIAVTYHQMWIQYIFYFLSLGMMFLSIRHPKRYWFFTCLSILSLLLELSVTEYFIGLELLRPIFIWFLLSQQNLGFRERLWSLIYKSIPYLLAFLAYLLWRFFLMRLVVDDPYQMVLLNDLLTHPFDTIAQLGQLILIESSYVLITRWSELFSVRLFQEITPFIIISWLAAFLTASLLAYYLIHLIINNTVQKNSHPPKITTSPYAFTTQTLIIGILSIPLAILPAWLIGRQVLTDFHSNRHAMAAMLGASLFWISIIDWSIQKEKIKVIWLSILIGLSVAFCLRIGNNFRWVWTDQVRFYWQLAWRAPYIQPGTAIIFEDEPFPDQGMFSTSSAINFLYPQPKNAQFLGYWAYTLIPRFTYVEEQPATIPLRTSFRSLKFVGKTPDSLLLHYDRSKGNCWWLLDSEDSENPDISDLERRWLYISSPARIEIEKKSENYPPESIIGTEPTPTWCYYYQIAELARQGGNWQKIVELGHTALDEGYTPGDPRSKSPHEWMPFIEGFINTNEWAIAKEITLQAAISNQKYIPTLCNIWEQGPAQKQVKSEYSSIKQEIFNQLTCQP